MCHYSHRQGSLKDPPLRLHLPKYTKACSFHYSSSFSLSLSVSLSLSLSLCLCCIVCIHAYALLIMLIDKRTVRLSSSCHVQAENAHFSNKACFLMSLLASRKVSSSFHFQVQALMLGIPAVDSLDRDYARNRLPSHPSAYKFKL